NPYYWNASHVYVPYCSSHIWSGDSAARAPGDFLFLGSRIVEHVIRELLPRGLTDAKLLILAGSSAGAAGVMINLDLIASLLTSVGLPAQVKGIADSGWIMDNKPIVSPNSAPIGAANTGNVEQSSAGRVRRTIHARAVEVSIRVPSVPNTAHTPIHVPVAVLRGTDAFGRRIVNPFSTPIQVYPQFGPTAQGIPRERVSLLTKPDWRTIAINGVRLPDAIRCWEQTCSGPTQPTTSTYSPSPVGGPYTVINRHSPPATVTNGTLGGAQTVPLNDWPLAAQQHYTKQQQKKKHKRRKHMRRRHKTKREQIVLNDTNSSNNNSTGGKSSGGTGSSSGGHKSHNSYHHSHHNEHRLRAHSNQCHHWLVDDCQWPQCNRECPKMHKNYMD
ncbi:unnamed protein product, partial [Medioppia subpectinata]